MTVWQTIRDNFKTLMEEGIRNDATNLFHETPSGPDIAKVPNSIFDGVYSISCKGMSKAYAEVNGTLTFEYSVLLKLGFIINQEDKNDPDTDTMDKSKSEYHDAISDIEIIVRKRLTTSTFTGLDNIELQSIGALEFLDKPETYAVCDLSFIARGTTAL